MSTTRNIYRGSSSSSAFRRHQSSLEMQRNQELLQTRSVLQTFAEQNATSSWAQALGQISRAHKQGIPIHSDALAPIIRETGNFEIAKKLFYNAHTRFQLKWSEKTKEAMMISAANHGEWEFALGFLSKGVCAKNSSFLSLDVSQMMANQTIKSLNVSASPSNTNWALALSTVAMMRNPQKEFVWNRRDLYGAREKRKQKEDNTSPTVSAPADRKTQKIAATSQLMEDLMSILGKSNRWYESVLLLRAIERQQENPITTSTYESAIRACYSKRKHDEVIGIVNRILVSSPSERNTLREPVARLTLRSLEASSASGGRGFINGLPSPRSPAANYWRTSLTIFRALADQGLALTRQTYESPIRCCVAVGQWEIAARMITEMRRDGLTAGTNVIESVVSAKVAYGCATSDMAVRLFESLTGKTLRMRRPTSEEENQDSMMPAVIELNTRTYNALLAAAVQHKNFGLVVKVLDRMKRSDILQNKDTKKWLIRYWYYKQDWQKVLRNFLFFRKDVLTEVQVSQKLGYSLWPSEYQLDDDLAKMVLEACEMLGLGDPLTRSIAESVLTSKASGNEFHEEQEEESSGDDEKNKQLLLPSSTTTKFFKRTATSGENIQDLSNRIETLRQELRRNELGDAADLPGGVKPRWSSEDDFKMPKIHLAGQDKEEDDLLMAIPPVLNKKK